MKSYYGLGIDAGGTYTDAVLLHFSTGAVLCSSKSPTTQPDPSEGIRNALSKMDLELLPRVRMVALATTFATNAIVEDRGAEAGLILVGYDELPPEIPRNTRILMVAGGHTGSGEEKVPLDLETVEKKLDTFLDGLDAVAVAAFFSVRNPEHEVKVAQLLHDRHHLPVVQGHQLSMRLDALKRATTAWWNARLISLISNLINAANAVLAEKGIQAPLMVVRGDGTLMSAQTALDRPVDTLLSGPAASILGAKHLSGVNDALIVDMGGTTTDMAVLEGGRVAIDPQGAQVGRWKTHVEAANVKTIGVGGDSLISVNADRALTVGPRRAVPLCVMADLDPGILETLQIVLRRVEKARWGRTNPCAFYMNAGNQDNGKKSSLPDYLSSGPVNEFLLQEGSRNRSLTWELKRLEHNGAIIRSALTPTDIRVATGRLHLGNQEAAKFGLAIFAKYTGVEEPDLIETVEEEIRKRLCLEAVIYVGKTNDEVLSKLSHRWFQRSPSHTNGIDLDVRVSLTAPVLGVGAPAAAYLPPTFRRLHADCILPKGYEVSVAVGSVVGMVDTTVTGIIRPDTTGRYILHTNAGREHFNTLKEAVERGQRVLEALARKRMQRDYVHNPFVDCTVKEKNVKTRHGEEFHLETELSLRAWGRPNVWEQADPESPFYAEEKFENTDYSSMNRER